MALAPRGGVIVEGRWATPRKLLDNKGITPIEDEMYNKELYTIYNLHICVYDARGTHSDKHPRCRKNLSKVAEDQ